MPHFAMTEDEVEVASWTGSVPHKGETIWLDPMGPAAACGRWLVDTVDWRVTSGFEAASRAELTVSPLDDMARAWLVRARAERAKESA